jgi:hypothetical protein
MAILAFIFLYSLTRHRSLLADGSVLFQLLVGKAGGGWWLLHGDQNTLWIFVA